MLDNTPWTQEQVDALNRYQAAGEYHPYTCGNGSHVLTATPEGWVCEECRKLGREYRQGWCHRGSIEIGQLPSGGEE